MEHYKAIFATTALMVFGLITVSHVAYPRDPEEDRPRVKAAKSVEPASAVPSAWVDPPRLRVAAPDAAAPARPAMFTLLSPETVALFLVATGAKPVRVATVRRQRVARLQVRTRVMTVPASPAATAVQPGESPPPEKAAQTDLIGDLIRNLGIGRNS